MKDGTKKELGTGRVAFLARQEEIRKEIEKGRTVMSVYREFGAKVGISYSQFDRYVNKIIRGKPHGNEGKKAEESADSPAIEPGTKESVVRKAVPTERKFVRKENRDDLINPKE